MLGLKYNVVLELTTDDFFKLKNCRNFHNGDIMKTNKCQPWRLNVPHSLRYPRLSAPYNCDVGVVE